MSVKAWNDEQEAELVKLYTEVGEKDVHKDIAPDVLPLCGECWWCRERQWALDEVHKRLHK